MNKKKFNPKGKKERFMGEPQKAKISEITHEDIGKAFSLRGVVDRVVQTPGPTVFYINDGTGTLAIKAFQGAGVRAFEEIEEESIVRTIVRIEEFQDEIEGEVSKLSELEGEDKEKFVEELKAVERQRARVEPPEFLAKSEILDKLKESFIKAATEIRLAIIRNRPVIVRHHNDADGYSSGFALERAILPLIAAQHGGGKSTWEFYTRAPCAAPFYEIEDSIKDSAMSLRNVAKFSNKMPLVVITDNGSSPEDLFAIKQGKVHGIDFIVVDHHYFDKDVISEETLVHINPFLVGEDGAKYSAGMLCSELARFINPDVKNIEQIPAMAGMADRIDNEQVMDQYKKIADENGYDSSLLADIATVIDFVSAKLRFMEAREYIEVLFGEPKDKQKDLVNLMAPYIRKLEAKGLEISKAAVKKEKIGKVLLQTLEIEQTFSRGFYPKPGKCTGIVHDYAKTQEGIESVVTAGLLNDAITMRATDEANFSVHDLIAYLRENLPQAFVDGGGHKNAGAITFIPSKKEEVVKLLKEFIKSR